MSKKVQYAGADEKTPSKAHYFSWINSTNEGSTEAQTIVNLEFFAYLKKQYGMQLDIYAWDAGNLDGASGTYETKESKKLKEQYPNGYLPCVRKAKEIGIRLGVWGGADGYGNTKEEENERRELLVKLCRDYHFALFKFDSVCGKLRRNKHKAFIETLKECRQYSDDLILLNHRNKLGLAKKYATTFLWQGGETYVDILTSNSQTAPHHRAFAFTRGLVPHLKRLTEDHGVCISSCVDYFEDDMIVQAFSRSLILAPEVYGNPWFMRDDELPIFARIYNLHRKYRNILVNGKKLPSKYGKYAVSRGDNERRFIVLTNPTWERKSVELRISSKLGLKKTPTVKVIIRFPYEGLIGNFVWESVAKIEVPPFRAVLIEAVAEYVAEPIVSGCKYLVLNDGTNGEKKKLKIIASNGQLFLQKDMRSKMLLTTPIFDNTQKDPIIVGQMQVVEIQPNDRQLYEVAMFSIDNDSYERQSIKRSGKSEIEEVNNARNAFFSQQTYINRGCDYLNMFDNNPDTFFDARSLTYCGGFRIMGGCLRIDIGRIAEIDEIKIDYFEAYDNRTGQTPPQDFSVQAEYSEDLNSWHTSDVDIRIKAPKTVPLVIEKVHNITNIAGEIKTASFDIHNSMRYFVLPKPMYRIHNVSFYKDGKELKFDGIKANNLMAPYQCKPTVLCYKLTVDVPFDIGEEYFAIAIEGYHGVEGVYCVGECKGKYYGAEDRASSYPCNIWEHSTAKNKKYYTYYLSINKAMRGKKVDIYALFNNDVASYNLPIFVYRCPKHIVPDGIEIEI